MFLSRLAWKTRATSRLAVLAAAVAVVACRGDAPLAPRAGLAGTYVLATVNATGLPQTYGESRPASGGKVLMADTLTLAADGSVRRTLILRVYAGYSGCYLGSCYPAPDTRTEERGTWGVRGDNLSLRFAPASARVLRGWVAADGALVVTDTAIYYAGVYTYHR